MQTASYPPFGGDRNERDYWGERAVAALERVGALWRERLETGWAPPAGSTFPWAQVRPSLAALVTGLVKAGEWRRWAIGGVALTLKPSLPTIALILAGNTPLMSWSPIAAALMAGCRLRIKASREETLWPSLLIDSLLEVEPTLSNLIELYVWPGDDARTRDLVETADILVAFGSDETLKILRSFTETAKPFFGYGHAVSVGLVAGADPRAPKPSVGFSRDVLMFGQGGCLSPHAIFVRNRGDAALDFSRDYLPPAMSSMADTLDVPSVRDLATAAKIREARDLAAFDGWQIFATDDLRWTVAYTQDTLRELPLPVGYGFVYVLPHASAPERIVERFGAMRGRISSVGVAGTVSVELEAALKAEGVSRICKPGEMQTPPLDWKNGGFDLLAELLKI